MARRNYADDEDFRLAYYGPPPPPPPPKRSLMSANAQECPFCRADAGVHAAILPSGCCISTAMATHEFFDELGRAHYHDSNVLQTRFQCARGHRGELKSRAQSCPVTDCASNTDSDGVPVLRHCFTLLQ